MSINSYNHQYNLNFSHCFDTCEDWVVDCMESAVAFWFSSGAPKVAVRKADISNSTVFLQPAFWGVWALCCSHGDSSLLGNIVSPGPISKAFIRIAKTHALLHINGISVTALGELADKLLRHFFAIAIPFVQGCMLGAPVEETMLLLLAPVKAARTDVVESFRGTLKQADIATQAKKDHKKLLFGRSQRSASSSDSSSSDSDSGVAPSTSASVAGASGTGTRRNSRQRKRLREQSHIPSVSALATGLVANKATKVAAKGSLSVFDVKPAAIIKNPAADKQGLQEPPRKARKPKAVLKVKAAKKTKKQPIKRTTKNSKKKGKK